MLAALRGIAVLGPLRETAPTPSRSRATGSAPRRARARGAERDAALAELARRYLAAHGPATRRRPRRVERPAAARRPRRAEGDRRELGRATTTSSTSPPRAAARRSPPRLLGRVRPLPARLEGPRLRRARAAHAKRVHPGGGMLRADATVDGRAVGTWTRRGRRRDARPLRTRGRTARKAGAARRRPTRSPASSTSARPSSGWPSRSARIERLLVGVLLALAPRPSPGTPCRPCAGSGRRPSAPARRRPRRTCRGAC